MPRSLLVFEPPDGGVAQHVLELARGLPAQGWEVAVAGPSESVIYPALAESGIAFERLPIGRALRPVPYASALSTLRRRAASGRYDVMHVHSSKAGAIVRPAARLGGAPVVYTPHCFPFIGPQGARRRVLSTFAERALAPITDAFICVSHDERREALAQRVGRPETLEVVHNGCRRCESAEPSAELAAHLSAGPSAATIAVLRPQKGIDVFVRAAPAILAAVPQARLAVIGQGELRGDLEQLARGLGVGESLRFFDFAAPASRALGSLDLFVLPSRWEAFPISILEALACGVPQVASDVGGTREALIHGETGLLCPPEDDAGLAAAVIELLRAPRRREAMGRASAERHRDCFGIDRMVAETAAVYDRAVSGHR